MDFEHTGPEKEFSASVARFAEEHLAGGAAARARAGEMSWEAAGILADQGLMGITIPTNKGGRGGTLMQAVIAIQQLAMVCPKSADIVQAGNFGAIRTFAEYATEEQRQRLLPDLLAGRKLMSLGMSEPEAGSAATELVTSATEDGDDFILNGSKVYGTHSVDAEVFLIYVRYGPGVGGIGSVLVERGAPGFTWGPPKAFMSGEKWCELHFENCRIPASNVLLGPGGFKKQIAGFNVERIGNSARSIALGRYTFNQARDYAKRRVQFGKSLSQFQGLQWKFADMAVKLEAAELLLFRAVVNADKGFPSAYETSVAKAACNQAAFDVAHEAIQIMGALGYSEDSLVEYCFRRIRGWMIAGGSIEMLKNRIAETVLDQRFDQRA